MSDPVDVFLDGRRIATTDWVDARLSEKIRGGSSVTREPARRARNCAHENAVEGFAYRDWSREHWPIRFCRDCYLILAGRDPRMFAPIDADGSPFGITPEEIISNKWHAQWPRDGKPRKKKPPPLSSWPAGY